MVLTNKIFKSIWIFLLMSLLMSVAKAQNVGIGTPSPDYMLDINGAIGINDTLFHNNDSDTWMAFPGMDQWEVSTGGRKMVHADGVGQKITINPNSSGIGFEILADGVDHLMYTDPAAKTIGIGTSSPAYLLDISGDFRIMGDAIDHLFYVNTAQNRLGIGTNVPAYRVDISGDFRIMGDAVDHLFFVESSTGRIGIGTANPAYKLDINGGLRVQGLTANDVFIVDPVNQRIGINTSNPAAAFEVAGEIAGDQIRVGNNPLPFLETFRNGTQALFYDESGSNVQTFNINFIPAFNVKPTVITTIANFNSGFSETIYIHSIKNVSATGFQINVEELGSGTPSDSLKINWIAWE